jgi:hypothetical protein
MKFNANLTRSVYGDLFFSKKLRFRDFEDFFLKIGYLFEYTLKKLKFSKFVSSDRAKIRHKKTLDYAIQCFFLWRIFAIWRGKKRGGYEFRVRKDKMRQILKLKNKIAHLSDLLSSLLMFAGADTVSVYNRSYGYSYMCINTRTVTLAKDIKTKK